MAKSLTPEEQARLNKLTLEEIKLKKEEGELNEAELAYLKEKLEVEKESLTALEKRKAQLETLIKQQGAIGERLTSNLVLRERENELTRVTNNIELEKLELYRKKLALGEKLELSEALQLKQLEKQETQLERNKKSYSNIDKIVKKTSLSIGDGLVQGMNDFARAIDEGKTGAFALGHALTLADAGIKTLFNTAKDLVFAFDSVTKEFEKQFQLGGRYRDMIESNYRSMNEYGVSLEETATSMGSLVTTATDFTMMSIDQQKVLVQTSSVLANLGVSSADFSAGIQNSMKLYGQSAADANTTSLELMATARALGVEPGLMAQQYAQMGSSLAKFGTEGTQTFKELARVQKLTGLEMGKLLNMTNKFDTFEGAAEQAGKLNAALGGNFVNAMDLMMATDPVERFDMIRGSLEDAGLSFNDMSYYQKQFYAESLGLSDVNDLALMMSGNTNLMTDATQKSAEQIEDEARRAQDAMKIKEKYQAVLMNIAEAFLPLASLLDTVAQKFLDNADEIKHVVNILGILGGLLTGAKIIGGFTQMAMAVKNAGSMMGFFAASTKTARLATMGLYGVLGTAMYLIWQFGPDDPKMKAVLIGLGLLAAAIFTVKRAMRQTSGAAGGMMGNLTNLASSGTRRQVAGGAGRALLGRGTMMGMASSGTGGQVAGGAGRALLGRGAMTLGRIPLAALLAGVGYGAYKATGPIASALFGDDWYRLGLKNGGLIRGSASGVPATVGEGGVGKDELVLPLDGRVLPVEIARISSALDNRAAGSQPMGAPSSQGHATTRNQDANLTVNLKLDGEILAKKVIKITQTNEGLRAAEAQQGIGGRTYT